MNDIVLTNTEIVQPEVGAVPVDALFTKDGKHWTQQELSIWAAFNRPGIELRKMNGAHGYVIKEDGELKDFFINCGQSWDDVAKRLEI